MKLFSRTTKFLKDVFFASQLGVGTDTPTATLDVNGDLRVRVVNQDNTLSKIVVIDTDGTVKSRELSTMLPNDIFIQSNAYDPVTNILNLTMTNGNSFDIDLSDLQDETDSKLIDADGDTFVEVERTSDDDTVRFGAGGVDAITMNDSQTTSHLPTNLANGASLPYEKITIENFPVDARMHTLELEETVSTPFSVRVNEMWMAYNFSNDTGGVFKFATITPPTGLKAGDTITIDGFTGPFVVFNKNYVVESVSGNEVIIDSAYSHGELTVIGDIVNMSGEILDAKSISLPEPSILIDGKVYEITTQEGGTATVQGTGYILGVGQIFDFSEHQTSYIKLQADAANNRYIVLEQDRSFGDLIDTTASVGGTTFTDAKLIGLTADNVDVWRDGSIEKAADYAIDAATGVMTVVGNFEGESLKIRLT